MTVLVYFHFQPFGKRVDRLDADAVQAARNFIARIAAELASGIDFGKHDFYRGNFFFGVRSRRNAAAVILYGTRTVFIDNDVNTRTVPRQRFVDGTDIHSRAFPDMFQPVKHLNLFRTVCAHNLFRHKPLLLTISIDSFPNYIIPPAKCIVFFRTF